MSAKATKLKSPIITIAGECMHAVVERVYWTKSLRSLSRTSDNLKMVKFEKKHDSVEPCRHYQSDDGSSPAGPSHCIA